MEKLKQTNKSKIKTVFDATMREELISHINSSTSENNPQWAI
ncbi:hypothetical protein [Lacibacter cauensis]|nr:hypothetical protein [Lacibacter cauensis]